MPDFERLLHIIKVHRTATQFRATDVVQAMTNIIGDRLPRFDRHGNQVSGLPLADLARVCRWVFTQLDFLDLEWKLKEYFAKYLQEDAECLIRSKEMCDMLNDCIFGRAAR